jgi:hypothetical protein
MNLLNKYSPFSKIWIYQSLKPIEPNILIDIHRKMESFIATWNSHGDKLEAGYEILDNRFLILLVDESKSSASGCSIDKSMAVIKEIDSLYNLGLLDRANVSYISPNGAIETISSTHLKQAVADRKIDSETIVFNNTITYLSQLQSEWKVKAKDSWLSRYLLKSIQA